MLIGEVVYCGHARGEGRCVVTAAGMVAVWKGIVWWGAAGVEGSAVVEGCDYLAKVYKNPTGID